MAADDIGRVRRAGGDRRDAPLRVPQPPPCHLVLRHPQGTNAALWLDTALASIATHRDACSVASCVAFVGSAVGALHGAGALPPLADRHPVEAHGA